MGNLKKIMSGSLAALILVGMLSTGISAKTFSDVDAENEYAEQIGILSDIGIIKGTGENTFSPDDIVTREQMALLLFRLMIARDNAGNLNTSPFTDLYDSTYNGAISWASASGYIRGTTAETFAPTAGIMLQDAMTMIIRALGQESAQMNAYYPWTYIDAAVKLGLDDGLEGIDYNKVLTRGELAVMLYNALTAEYLIPKTASNGYTFYESTTIIEKVFGYEIADSVIVATNNYAIGDYETVVKDGYVTLKSEDGLITVKYSELGLTGTADENLGENLRVVFKSDAKTKLVTVLGSTEIGKVTKTDDITVSDKNTYVKIGNIRYQVVETLSDELSTNANELLVYTYSNSGKLVQVKTNADLAGLLGAYEAKLIFDDSDSEIADRLILKPYSFAQLDVTSAGKINIANNMNKDDLTIVNPDKAADGDYVLYYFNDENDILEIAAVLTPSESSTITRLTSTSVTIGGVKYEIGNEKLGVLPSDIKAQLVVGEKVRVIAYNGAILALDKSNTSVYSASKYLVASSSTTPVFVSGKFGYVMEANIDGTNTTIFVSNETVTAGLVYRYTVSSDGTYTLIPYVISGNVIETGNAKFVQSNGQNDEIAFVIPSASGTVIVKNGPYSTISEGSANAISSTGNDESSFKFVTDANTVIVIKKGSSYTVKTGSYDSSITISDGASVTAVFSNEVGAVETLRYLYISDGSFGSVNSTANSVKVLAETGVEYVDGKTFTIYTVLNYTTGKVESMLSLDSSLSIGANYLTDISGNISSEAASIISGTLEGYTSATVTVEGVTYVANAATAVYTLNADNTTTATTISSAYTHEVEVIIANGVVTSIIVLANLT